MFAADAKIEKEKAPLGSATVNSNHYSFSFKIFAGF